MGIVSVEKGCSVQTSSDSTFDSFSIHNAAGRIGRSIRAISTGAQYDNLIDAADFECRSQCKFLISSAESVASNRDRRLTA